MLPCFGPMNGIDLSRNAAGLLIRINALTGWRLPEDPQLSNVLNSEFAEYLRTNAGDMNSKEIISAVRTNGLGIIEWGKSMNLGFIDQCVTPYRSHRAILSEMEERLSIDQKRTKFEQSISSVVDWSSEWGNVVYAAKIGQIRNVNITVDLYDWLVRVGKIALPDPNDELAVLEDKANKWNVVRECAAEYLVQIKDDLISGNGIEPPYELKRRIMLFENKTAPIWKRDTAIISTLNVLAKHAIVRNLALSAANDLV